MQWGNRYAHVRQFKRIRAPVTLVFGSSGARYLAKISAVGEIPEVLQHELAMANRLLEQKKKSKNKLHSLHATEVECIS